MFALRTIAAGATEAKAKPAATTGRRRTTRAKDVEHEQDATKELFKVSLRLGQHVMQMQLHAVQGGMLTAMQVSSTQMPSPAACILFRAGRDRCPCAG
jgi:hypothetical protein